MTKDTTDPSVLLLRRIMERERAGRRAPSPKGLSVEDRLALVGAGMMAVLWATFLIGMLLETSGFRGS